MSLVGVDAKTAYFFLDENVLALIRTVGKLAIRRSPLDQSTARADESVRSTSPATGKVVKLGSF